MQFIQFPITLNDIIVDGRCLDKLKRSFYKSIIIGNKKISQQNTIAYLISFFDDKANIIYK